MPAHRICVLCDVHVTLVRLHSNTLNADSRREQDYIGQKAWMSKLLILLGQRRYCSADASFCVKEVDLAIAADMGTLQRLPGIVGEGGPMCSLPAMLPAL